MAPTKMNFSYRKEIDGLRALAVLSIVLFHAGFSAFKGGYVGVDIFFVISGFLITSIIAQDQQQGIFTFRQFYERRARRLLPALFFVTFIAMGFAWAWMLPNEITEFSKSALSVLFFIANFFFWNDSGYFSTSAEYRPLLHTWSLSVEEQFYLIFPAFFVFGALIKRTYALGLLLLLGLCSLGLSIWASIHAPTFGFFLLPTRAWEFVMGSLSAHAVMSRSLENIRQNVLINEGIGAIGLLLIIYSIFSFNKNLPYPGYWAVLPTLGTTLLLVFTTQDTLLGKALGLRPVVVLGLISYSTYLWHQPLFAFLRLRELEPLTPTVSAVLVGISLLLGYTTWRFIEPIWRTKQLTSRKKSFRWFLFLGACTFVLFFLIVKYTGGYLFRLTHLPKDYFQTSWINYKFQGLDAQLCYTDDMKPCPLASFPEAKRRILLVGDSHAGDFGTVFTRFLNNHQYSGAMFSVLGCGYLSSLKDTTSNTSCSRARSLLLEMANRKTFDTFLVVSAGELHTTAEAVEFKDLMDKLLATGAKVVLFDPRMRLKYDPKKAGVLRLNEKNSVLEFDPSLSYAWLDTLKQLSQHSNFSLFDQNKPLLAIGCESSKCFNGHTQDGHLIYRDSTHLTDLGAKATFDLFEGWYQTKLLEK
jgi:peptidoglycan/LPS O-acetylase OafA/YrhL